MIGGADTIVCTPNYPGDAISTPPPPLYFAIPSALPCLTLSATTPLAHEFGRPPSPTLPHSKPLYTVNAKTDAYVATESTHWRETAEVFPVVHPSPRFSPHFVHLCLIIIELEQSTSFPLY